MFQAVIFDLDGTLLNTIDDLAAAGNFICAERGWPTYPVEAYKRMVGNGIPKLVERFSPPEARTPALLAQTLAAFSAYYSAHSAEKTAPYPGIPALLARLGRAGVKTGVLTNKAHAIAGPLLAHYFGPAFTAVRGSLPGVPPKPDPAGLRALLAQLGAAPGSALFVGDSDVDVATGHNGGLPVAGCLWGFRTRAELVAAGAEYLVAEPQQLERLLLN